MFFQRAADYALRSLVRHQTRTLLTVGTVALSVTVSIVANQYAKAVLKIWEQASIDRGTAHAQFHIPGFFDDPDSLKFETSFKDEGDLFTHLQTDSQIEGFSRRLLLEGIISAHGKTVYFLGKAVDGPAELKVSPALFTPTPQNGIFIDERSPEKVVLGRGLADSLDLKIGDEASLMVSTVHGAVNGLDVVIAGIIDLPIAMLSKRLLYMDLSAAQKAVEMPGGFNELAVRLQPGIDPRAWVSQQTQIDLDLRGWWDIDKIIVKAQDLWDAVVRLASFLLFMTAGLSVLNMILMLVFEQTIEIGTLLALGARARHIYTLVFWQASLIGFIGALVGTLIANVTILCMDLIGIPFESPFGGGIFLVHPKIGMTTTVVAFVAGIAVASLASILPARKAAKLEPVVAFRGQST